MDKQLIFRVSGIFYLGTIAVTNADQHLRLSLVYSVAGPYAVIVNESTILIENI